MERNAVWCTDKDGEQPSYMTDDEAFIWFCNWRWKDGSPACPFCGKDGHYFISTRKKFRCSHCAADYTPTSGTEFSHVKMGLPKLAAIITDLDTRSAYSTAARHRVNPRTTWLIATKLKAEAAK